MANLKDVSVEDDWDFFDFDFTKGNTSTNTSERSTLKIPPESESRSVDSTPMTETEVRRSPRTQGKLVKEKDLSFRSDSKNKNEQVHNITDSATVREERGTRGVKSADIPDDSMEVRLANNAAGFYTNKGTSPSRLHNTSDTSSVSKMTFDQHDYTDNPRIPQVGVQDKVQDKRSPITSQPLSGGEDPAPTPRGFNVEGHPEQNKAAFDFLKDVSHFVIRQQISMDIFGGCGRENSYTVYNKGGSQMLFVSEESNCACRWLCGPNRWFRLTAFSLNEKPVFHVTRAGCRFDWCCCLDRCCCLHRLDVTDTKGRQLGFVLEKFNLFKTRYEILTAEGDGVARIRGPCCECRCCYDVTFTILNKTGEKEIGVIRKMFGGRGTDGVNMDHELFEMECSPFLSPEDKVLLMGATFMMVIAYMEMS